MKIKILGATAPVVNIGERRFAICIDGDDANQLCWIAAEERPSGKNHVLSATFANLAEARKAWSTGFEVISYSDPEVGLVVNELVEGKDADRL